MTDFVQRLETELVRVGYRERRLRRVRLLQVAMPVAVAAAAAAVLVVAIDPATETERPVAPVAPVVRAAGLPGPPAGFEDQRVAVANGTTVKLAATRLTDALRQAGWKAGPVLNAPDQARTVTVVVYDAPEHEPFAQAVNAQLYDGALPVVSAESQDVEGLSAAPATIVLGADRANDSPIVPVIAADLRLVRTTVYGKRFEPDPASNVTAVGRMFDVTVGSGGGVARRVRVSVRLRGGTVEDIRGATTLDRVAGRVTTGVFIDRAPNAGEVYTVDVTVKPARGESRKSDNTRTYNVLFE